MKIGTRMVTSTVSIQNVADICNVCAFGAGAPSKKAMLSVPPPKSGDSAFVVIDIVVVAMIFCWLM